MTTNSYLAPYPIRQAKWCVLKHWAVSATIEADIRRPFWIKCWWMAPTARSIGMAGRVGSYIIHNIKLRCRKHEGKKIHSQSQSHHKLLIAIIIWTKTAWEKKLNQKESFTFSFKLNATFSFFLEYAGELRIIVLKDRMIQVQSRPWVSFLLHSLTSCIISEVNARLPFPKIGKF